MCTFTTPLFLYSRSQNSQLWDTFAFQTFQYIRERLLSLPHWSTRNYFRKSLYTQSACDRGVKLRGNDTERLSKGELLMTVRLRLEKMHKYHLDSLFNQLVSRPQSRMVPSVPGHFINATCGSRTMPGLATVMTTSCILSFSL